MQVDKHCCLDKFDDAVCDGSDHELITSIFSLGFLQLLFALPLLNSLNALTFLPACLGFCLERTVSIWARIRCLFSLYSSSVSMPAAYASLTRTS